MDLNDYLEYECLEQMQVYVDAAWNAGFGATGCTGCTEEYLSAAVERTVRLEVQKLSELNRKVAANDGDLSYLF